MSAVTSSNLRTAVRSLDLSIAQSSGQAIVSKVRESKESREFTEPTLVLDLNLIERSL